jgi:hypothetical protein
MISLHGYRKTIVTTLSIKGWTGLGATRCERCAVLVHRVQDGRKITPPSGDRISNPGDPRSAETALVCAEQSFASNYC